VCGLVFVCNAVQDVVVQYGLVVVVRDRSFVVLVVGNGGWRLDVAMPWQLFS
jgi:hypothetical protein